MSLILEKLEVIESMVCELFFFFSYEIDALMLSVIIEHYYWIKLIKKGGSEYGLINGFIEFMGCFLNKTDEKGGLLR